MASYENKSLRARATVFGNTVIITDQTSGNRSAIKMVSTPAPRQLALLVRKEVLRMRATTKTEQPTSKKWDEARCIDYVCKKARREFPLTYSASRLRKNR